MELLKGFVFDLQRHDDVWDGAIDLTGELKFAGETAPAAGTYYITVDGEDLVFTKTSTGNIGSITFSGKATAGASEGTYKVNVTSLKLNADITAGGAIDITANVKTAVTCGEQTEAAKLTTKQGDAETELFTATSFTWNGTELTAATSLTALVEGENTFKLKSASGTFANGGTFSGVTGDIGETNALTGLKSGTVKTDVSFEGGFSIEGVTPVTGEATYVVGTMSGGTKVTATLNGEKQTFATAGALVPFNVIGNSTDETFAISGDKNHTVSGGAGADVIMLGNAADTLDGGIVGAVSVAGGAGDDAIYAGNDVVSVKSGAVFNLGDGNNTVDLSGLYVPADEEVTEDGAAVTAKEITITSGSGADFVNLGGEVTKSIVSVGGGADTVVSASGTNTLYGGAGKDVFDISQDSLAAAVADYVFGEDVFAVAGDTTVVANALAAGDKKLSADENLGIMDSLDASNGSATVVSSAGYFAVDLRNVEDEDDTMSLAWAGENATKIDASSLKKSVVLVGTSNGEGDLLLGGSKNDTLYAGSDDSVYGGAGNDTYKLGDDVTGVYVGIAAKSGDDVVDGFKAGFSTEEADAIYLVEGSVSDLSFERDTDFVVKGGKSTLNFGNIANDDDGSMHLVINEKGVDKKVYAIASGETLTFNDDSEMGDYFIGGGSGSLRSGIALTGYTGDLQIDLNSSAFKNIASVTGGEGNTTIIGSTEKETLTGGIGATSLYGGAGNDMLVSGEGSTTFFQMVGGGKDSVDGFIAGTEDNSDVLNLSGVKTISRKDGNNFTVKVTDADVLTIVQGGTAGEDVGVKWVSGNASGVAKIGVTGTANSFTYEEGVTNYLGSSKNDTVSVAGGTTDSFEVWVDRTTAFSSIETYDMSGTAGDVLLAGKANTSETIVGGQGSSSLWGGAGNTKDVLVGNSSGITEFYYGLGEGSDSISGSELDSVNLYNITTDDIVSAAINDNNVVFTTTGNTTVTVNGGVGTFKLADGTAWTANYSTKNWDPANN